MGPTTTVRSVIARNGTFTYDDHTTPWLVVCRDLNVSVFKGFDAWVLSGNGPALKRIGLRASRKIQIFNGGIECRFQKYELYDGRRDKPQA